MANIIRDMDGNDGLVIYLTSEKAVKRMGPNWALGATGENLTILYDNFGKDNVKVVEKKVEFASPQYGKKKW